MQLNSFIFFLFLIIVTTIYYVVPSRVRNFILLSANYLFYSYYDYRFAVLLLLLTSTTHFIGNKIYDTKNYEIKKRFLIAGVVLNLVVLGIFKYFNFFSESFISFLKLIGFGYNPITLKILLPLGISFYVFQTLTYIFDIYWERIDRKFNFWNFAVFASFFPTIIAGPIERANRLLPQIIKERNFDKANLKYGISLIVIGLFRKVLIADTAGKIVNHILAEPKFYTSFEIFVVIILYAIQIYNDFAGYSNMARGAAKVLGFDIYINFKQPYFSKSIAEFWRRWHISLSLWLKDYLFTPLQLKFRNYRLWGNVIALIITFTLCGLWHGAAWTFIFWGFLYGFYMSFALVAAKQKKIIAGLISNESVLNFFRIVSTFTMVTFAWLIFRAESFSEVFLIISKLFEFTSGEFVVRFTKILLSYSVISFAIDYLEYKWQTDSILIKFKPAVGYAISLSIIIIVFAYLLTSDKSPFIYAQF